MTFSPRPATARRARRAGSALAASVVFGLVLAAPEASRAQQALVHARAAALARAGDCEHALQILSEAPERAESGSGLLLRGQCELARRDPGSALEALDRARDLDPSLPHVDLLRAIAAQRMGDLERSRAVLEAAQATSGERPEFHYYRGLNLLSRAEHAEGAAALERARALGPELVEPEASFYAGMAYVQLGEKERARRSFQRVATQYPGTPWAEAALRWDP